LMLRWGVGGDVTENGVAAESTADLGRDHERIGLALPDAELRDVVLDIGLNEVGMIGIVELPTATGLQVVDPRPRFSGRQPTAPARSSRFLRIFSCMCSPPGSWSVHSSSTQRRPSASWRAERRIIAARALRSLQPLKLVSGT